jgi:hypothetical protein
MLAIADDLAHAGRHRSPAAMEDGDLVAATKELPNDVRTDEAGPTNHQDVHGPLFVHCSPEGNIDQAMAIGVR